MITHLWKCFTTLRTQVLFEGGKDTSHWMTHPPSPSSGLFQVVGMNASGRCPVVLSMDLRWTSLRCQDFFLTSKLDTQLPSICKQGNLGGWGLQMSPQTLLDPKWQVNSQLQIQLKRSWHKSNKTREMQFNVPMSLLANFICFAQMWPGLSNRCLLRIEMIWIYWFDKKNTYLQMTMIFNPKQVDHPSFSQKLKVKHRSSRARSPLIHRETLRHDWLPLVTKRFPGEQRWLVTTVLVILDESEMNLIAPWVGTESPYPPGWPTLDLPVRGSSSFFFMQGIRSRQVQPGFASRFDVKMH